MARLLCLLAALCALLCSVAQGSDKAKVPAGLRPDAKFRDPKFKEALKVLEKAVQQKVEESKMGYIDAELTYDQKYERMQMCRMVMRYYLLADVKATQKMVHDLVSEGEMTEQDASTLLAYHMTVWCYHNIEQHETALSNFNSIVKDETRMALLFNNASPDMPEDFNKEQTDVYFKVIEQEMIAEKKKNATVLSELLGLPSAIASSPLATAVLIGGAMLLCFGWFAWAVARLFAMQREGAKRREKGEKRVVKEKRGVVKSKAM